MNIWESYANSFKSIDVKAIVIAIVKDLSEVILDINRGEQLYLKGELSDGSFLDSYTSTTIAYKVATPGVDKRIENMTLKSTGGFYDGFKLMVTNDEIIITSTDEKTSELTGRYSKNIFGLTDENWQDLVDSNIVPNLIIRINNEL